MARNEHQLRHTTYDIKRNDKRFGMLLNQLITRPLDFRDWECYAILKDNKPLCVWSYHSYIGLNHSRSEFEAEISIAANSKKWPVKYTVRNILSLFFGRNGYNRVTALVHKDNRQAVKLVELAGFIVEGIIRKPEGQEDILQYSLLKQEWKGGNS